MPSTSPIAIRPRRAPSTVILALFFVLIAIFFLSGCAHRKPTQGNVPAPPPPAESTEPTEASPATNLPPSKPAPKPREPKPSGSKPSEEAPAEADLAEPILPSSAKPILTETGLASWYGPPYHNRRGSNGEIYNMHAMTAAHRTYPLGSIVRVTNVKTGATALVRITDRGPFIPGRVVDLSLAAAKKLDVYQPGVAQVKVELMQSAASRESPGKWAVQIGGFPHQPAATKLADHLKRRYRTAQVLCFASPAGDWWIRIRVLDDDHTRAQKLAAETQTPEGSVFLVRLD
jgi:rare lipoprotein A